jgi:uncharacterized RmlC-like cupin family protein
MSCKRIRSTEFVEGKQGLNHVVGISAESAGAQAIHLQLLTIPPAARAKAHKHVGHETAIYALAGCSGCWFGEGLEQHAWVEAGDYFYIPADMPHLPYNPSDTVPFVCVIARTDPEEQESVSLLPRLDDLAQDKDLHPPDAEGIAWQRDATPI